MDLLHRVPQLRTTVLGLLRRLRGVRLIARKRMFGPTIQYLSGKQSSISSDGVLLVWETGGFDGLLGQDAIFAHALAMKGMKPLMIICDGAPVACIQRGVELGESVGEWAGKCNDCHLRMRKAAKECLIPTADLSEFLDEEILEDCRSLATTVSLAQALDLQHGPSKVGQHAFSSTVRYMKGRLTSPTQLTGDSEQVFREYLFAALIHAHAAHNAITRLQPEIFLTSHGVYVDYAPPMEMAASMGVKTYSWASGYGVDEFYFTRPKADGLLQLRGITDDEWNLIESEPLSESRSARLTQYMDFRYSGSGARDMALRAAECGEATASLARIGFAGARTIGCIFAHVNWDAAFDLGYMLYESPNDWLIETIRSAVLSPDVDWLIRIHPGEIDDGSLASSESVVRQEFPILPENIRLLPASDRTPLTALMGFIDFGVTIFGTVGLELPLRGIPVILAGKAHYSGKGFTNDPRSRLEYESLLAAGGRLSPVDGVFLENARKYAYDYFIARPVKLGLIDASRGDRHFETPRTWRLRKLRPGASAGVDALTGSMLIGGEVRGS
jgi:hypothetical protein